MKGGQEALVESPGRRPIAFHVENLDVVDSLERESNVDLGVLVHHTTLFAGQRRIRNYSGQFSYIS